MKFIKNVLKFFKKDKKIQENIAERFDESDSMPFDYAKSKKIIGTSLIDHSFFEIGNPPCVEKPVFSAKYISGFINAEKGLLTVGVCTDYGTDFIYQENSGINIAYTEKKELFLAAAEIESIEQIREDDSPALLMLKKEPDFEERIKNYVEDTQKLSLYILKLRISEEPRRHQRRYHFRVTANWVVNFKIIKPDAELGSEQKKWVAEKIFDSENGLLKIKTVDVSAGGFKSTIKKRLPEGINLECTIEINGLKIDSSSEIIIGKVLDCNPNREINELFDLRVQFTQMPEETKEAVTDNILLELNKNKS